MSARSSALIKASVRGERCALNDLWEVLVEEHPRYELLARAGRRGMAHGLRHLEQRQAGSRGGVLNGDPTCSQHGGALTRLPRDGGGVNGAPAGPLMLPHERICGVVRYVR